MLFEHEIRVIVDNWLCAYIRTNVISYNSELPPSVGSHFDSKLVRFCYTTQDL